MEAAARRAAILSKLEQADRPVSAAALAKENVVVLRNRQQPSKGIAQIAHHRLHFRPTVTRFQNGPAAAVIVEQFRLNALQNAFGEHGRTRTEIEYARHA